MENTKVKLNRMRQQTPKQRHHASWRAGNSPPWPPLFFTHKTDVHTSWGLPGATVQRPTFPVSCGHLEEGASPPATMCNKPPQIQMTQECPGHRSTLQRKHPVHQQSAEPESPPPPPRTLSPRAGQHCLASVQTPARGGLAPHQGRFPGPNHLFQNPAH